MGKHKPAERLIASVLAKLREGGEGGATGRELGRVSGRFYEALSVLGRRGYVIEREPAHIRSPFGSIKRYRLRAEPRDDQAA